MSKRSSSTVPIRNVKQNLRLTHEMLKTARTQTGQWKARAEAAEKKLKEVEVKMDELKGILLR